MKFITKLLLLFPLVNLLHAASPLSSFYAKTGCKTQAILISINLADCNNCIAPLGRVIKKFKEINPAIPVYLVMSDSLPEEGEKIYRDRNEIRPGDIQFIYDKPLSDYFLSKSDRIPNVSLVSEQQTILCIRNLKTETLDKIIQLISPELKVMITKKTPIHNKYAPIGKVFTNVLFYDKTFYVFSENMGLIAEYDKNGSNLGNFFIDSLIPNYPQAAKELLCTEDYISSMAYYEREKPRKSFVVYPKTIFKIGEGLLGIGCYVESFKDTIYKKQSADLMVSHPFVIIVDTDFRFIKRLTIKTSSHPVVAFDAQVVYMDSSFYCLAYRHQSFSAQISEFKQDGTELRIKKVYPEPFQAGKKYYVQILNNVGENPDALYIGYEKGRGSSTRVIKTNIHTQGYEPEITVPMPVMAFHETKKGNFLFMTYKKGVVCCRGYDAAKKKTVEIQPAAGGGILNGTNPKAFFLFDGFLHEFSYTE